MMPIRTADNSYTVYNEKYKETYHSMSGAIEEAFEKFINPCKIRNGFKILNICFGLGYNILASIYNHKNLKIISLEKEIPNLDNLPIPKYLEKKFQIIKLVAKTLHHKDENEIIIIEDDATKTIKTINERFDAVYLDPFSYPKNPELWSIEFLEDIRKLMKPKAILSTYSCSKIVRNNMIEAGFKIKDGPLLGKRFGTIASI